MSRGLGDVYKRQVFTKTSDKTRGTAMPEQYLSLHILLDIVCLLYTSDAADE
ncbi:hypothetical protein JMUB7524_27380 [Staphylococcus aureus]